MASFNLFSGTAVARTLNDDESGIVGRFASIQTVSSPAVSIAGDNTILHVDGAISTISAFAISSGFIDGATVTISETGTVSASSIGSGLIGIVLRSTSLSLDFMNAGSVMGAFGGVLLDANNDAVINAVNTGSITGSRAVSLFTDSGTVDFTNSGVMTVSSGSAETGIRLQFGSSATDRPELINSGVISSTGFSINILNTTSSPGVDITNTGTLIGDVDLGVGDDLFNSRYGITNGIVIADAGDDTVRGTAGQDEVLAGEGDDHVMGYHGNDTLIGGAGSDTLYGNAGDDSLDGGGRADRIVAGKGDDTMTGAGGADTFVLRRVGNGDDEITDFQDGTDVIDMSALGLQNFNALQSSGALSNDTDAAVIDLELVGGSGSLRVGGIQVSDLGGSDFIF